jgi:hypothetical protein
LLGIKCQITVSDESRFLRNTIENHLSVNYFELYFTVVNLKSNPGEIFREKLNESNSLKADCTLTLSDDDMQNLVTLR